MPVAITDPTKGTLLTPPLIPATFARLELALTKDGTTPTGTTKTISMLAGGSVQILGGVTDPWGATLAPADLNASTFGVLIRRPDQNADEATTTARTVESVGVIGAYHPSGSSFVMPERVAGTQTNLIGKETTRGTAVAPSVRLKAARIMWQPVNENKEFRFQGDLLPGDFAITSEASEGVIDGDLSYDEIGYLLASIVGKPVTQLISTGVYRHTFNLNTRGAGDVQTYTSEYGDPTNAERVPFAILAELGFGLSRKDAKITGKFLGRKIADQAGITSGANCVQTVTTTSTTTFKLRFKGADMASALTVAGLTAGAFQTALEALPTLGVGQVTVSGSGPYVVTLAGTLAGLPQPILEVAASTGTAPTIALTTAGGYTELAVVPVLPGNLSVYYASTLATLSANKLTRLFTGDVSMANRFAPVWAFDDTQSSWATAVESPMSLGMKMVLAADTIASGMATDARNRTRKYLRLLASGPDITVGVPHLLQVDLACKVKLIENFKESGEIYARGFEVGTIFDPAWGQSAQFTLQNGVTSY